MANNVDPDQTPPSAASDQGLHYLLIPARPNTCTLVNKVAMLYTAYLLSDFGRTAQGDFSSHRKTCLDSIVFY